MGCRCPELPEQLEEKWDNKEIIWNEKFFYITNISMLINIPSIYQSKLNSAIEEIKEKGYYVVEPIRILSRDGWFGGQLLIEIEKPNKVDPRVHIFKKTRFFSKVFQGQKHLLSLEVKDLVSELEQKGEVVTDIYYWNLTCSVCAIEKGYKNVILAMLEEKRQSY